MKSQKPEKNNLFIKYEYGEDLFGYMYLDKIKIKDKGKLIKSWVLNDLGAFVRLLDFEIIKRESERYESIYNAI